MDAAAGLGRPPRRLAPRLGRALPAGLAALLLLATVASFLGRWSWQLDLLSHFRPQLAAAGVLCVVAALWSRSQALLALALGLTFINALPVAPYTSGDRAWGGPAAAERPGRLRVLTFNLHGRSTDGEAFRRLIDREKPDVILLAEAPEGTDRLLQSWDSRYAHSVVADRSGPLDVMLVTRWEPHNTSVDRSIARFRSVLRTDLCDPADTARCFTLVGLHADQPFGDGAMHQQGQLDIAAREIASASGAVLLMGDLNMAPWSRTFGSFIERTGLSDSARARSLTGTWFSRFPLLGLPIDHILVGPGFDVVGSRVGEDLGSDHLPVLAELLLRGAERSSR